MKISYFRVGEAGNKSSMSDRTLMERSSEKNQAPFRSLKISWRLYHTTSLLFLPCSWGPICNSIPFPYYKLYQVWSSFFSSAEGIRCFFFLSFDTLNVKSEFLIATASSNSIAIAVNSIAVFYRFHSLPSNAYSIPPWQSLWMCSLSLIIRYHWNCSWSRSSLLQER